LGYFSSGGDRHWAKMPKGFLLGSSEILFGVSLGSVTGLELAGIDWLTHYVFKCNDYIVFLRCLISSAIGVSLTYE